MSENVFNLVTLRWIRLQKSPDQVLGCVKEKPLLQEGRVMINTTKLYIQQVQLCLHPSSSHSSGNGLVQTYYSFLFRLSPLRRGRACTCTFLAACTFCEQKQRYMETSYLAHEGSPVLLTSSLASTQLINPRSACAARVTILGLCVCVSVTQHLTLRDYSCHKQY